MQNLLSMPYIFNSLTQSKMCKWN